MSIENEIKKMTAALVQLTDAVVAHTTAVTGVESPLLRPEPAPEPETKEDTPAPKVEAAKSSRKRPQAAVEQEPDTTGELSLQDLYGFLTDLGQRGMGQTIRDYMSEKYGTTVLSQVDPKHYRTIHADMQNLAQGI